VKGIEVVGPLPPHLQTPAMFSAGRMTCSRNIKGSDQLLNFLASPEATPALIESGLERLA
jgi:molybdate transport system substrate-binding protein